MAICLDQARKLLPAPACLLPLVLPSVQVFSISSHANRFIVQCAAKRWSHTHTHAHRHTQLHFCCIGSQRHLAALFIWLIVRPFDLCVTKILCYICRLDKQFVGGPKTQKVPTNAPPLSNFNSNSNIFYALLSISFSFSLSLSVCVSLSLLAYTTILILLDKY